MWLRCFVGCWSPKGRRDLLGLALKGLLDVSVESGEPGFKLREGTAHPSLEELIASGDLPDGWVDDRLGPDAFR